MIYVVIGRETIDDLAESVGFDSDFLPPTEPNTIYAVIQAIDDPIRFCIDGTPPVADTTGMRLTKDNTTEVWGAAALAAFRCIDDGGTAKLEVIYMGQGG